MNRIESKTGIYYDYGKLSRAEVQDILNKPDVEKNRKGFWRTTSILTCVVLFFVLAAEGLPLAGLMLLGGCGLWVDT